MAVWPATGKIQTAKLQIVQLVKCRFPCGQEKSNPDPCCLKTYDPYINILPVACHVFSTFEIHILPVSRYAVCIYQRPVRWRCYILKNVIAWTDVLRMRSFVCHLLCIVVSFFQFQLNPGVLPFFPSQFLPKDTPAEMFQPFSDRFSTADESPTDWNPLDYNAVWTHDPQSPFGHASDEDGADAQTITAGHSRVRLPASDSQHRAPVVQDQHAHCGLPEQVIHCCVCVFTFDASNKCLPGSSNGT